MTVTIKKTLHIMENFSIIGSTLLAVMTINGMNQPNQLICSNLQDIKIEGTLFPVSKYNGCSYLSTKKRNKINQINKSLGLPHIFPHDPCVLIHGWITKYNDEDKAINFMIENGGSNEIAKRITTKTKNPEKIKPKLKKFLNNTEALHFGLFIPIASLIHKKDILTIKTDSLNLTFTSKSERYNQVYNKEILMEDLLWGENNLKKFSANNIYFDENETFLEALESLAEEKILKKTPNYTSGYGYEHGEWGWPMEDINKDLIKQPASDIKPINLLHLLKYRETNGSFPKK